MWKKKKKWKCIKGARVEQLQYSICLTRGWKRRGFWIHSWSEAWHGLGIFWKSMIMRSEVVHFFHLIFHKIFRAKMRCSTGQSIVHMLWVCVFIPPLLIWWRTACRSNCAWASFPEEWAANVVGKPGSEGQTGQQEQRAESSHRLPNEWDRVHKLEGKAICSQGLQCHGDILHPKWPVKSLQTGDQVFKCLNPIDPVSCVCVAEDTNGKANYVLFHWATSLHCIVPQCLCWQKMFSGNKKMCCGFLNW